MQNKKQLQIVGGGGLVILNISELKPYENNPRINDKAVDAVAASIKEFGFKVPIIIDKNNVIVAGHTRLKAAQKLGLEEVPVIVADDLTEEQIKAFRLADNKVGEIAEWDFDKLNEELAELEMDMSKFDFELTLPNENDDDDNINTESNFKYKEQYAVIVTCESESEQEQTYNKLQAEGYNCKVVSV